MKLISAVFVAFLASGPVSAQYWSVGGFGSIAFPALGHAPARGNPWGNVVSPAIPQGAAAFASGLGAGRYGVASGRGYNAAGSGHRRGAAGGIYAFPAYIGGYGDSYAGPDTSTQPDQPAPQSPAQPPVVINQYFGTPPADQGAPTPTNGAGPEPGNSSYYLIAFKDHSVYSAVAYYTEGDTLHYFTSGNVHNQASLSLVDRQLTEQLNRAHNVEVRLPQ